MVMPPEPIQVWTGVIDAQGNSGQENSRPYPYLLECPIWLAILANCRSGRVGKAVSLPFLLKSLE